MLIRLILSLANLNISRTLSLMNVIYEWNKLDPDIRSSASYSLFRNTLSKLLGLLTERRSILMIQ